MRAWAVTGGSELTHLCLRAPGLCSLPASLAFTLLCFYCFCLQLFFRSVISSWGGTCNPRGTLAGSRGYLKRFLLNLWKRWKLLKLYNIMRNVIEQYNKYIYLYNSIIAFSLMIFSYFFKQTIWKTWILLFCKDALNLTKVTVNYNVQCYKKGILQIYCVILYSSKCHVSTKLFGSTVIINISWNQHIRMISEWFVINHILKYIHIKQHCSDITFYLYFSLNKCHFGELKRLNKNINTFHWPQTFVQKCTWLWLYVTQSVIHPQHWFVLSMI